MKTTKLILSLLAVSLIPWATPLHGADIVRGASQWARLTGIDPAVGRAFCVASSDPSSPSQAAWVLAGRSSRGWLVLDHSLIGYTSRWTEGAVRQAVNQAESAQPAASAAEETGCPGALLSGGSALLPSIHTASPTVRSSTTQSGGCAQCGARLSVWSCQHSCCQKCPANAPGTACGSGSSSGAVASARALTASVASVPPSPTVSRPVAIVPPPVRPSAPPVKVAFFGGRR